MHCYIGCSGFYNKDWKEVFYPKGLAQSKWFEFYCTEFNTLELNTTFYRFPRVEFLEKWNTKSPGGFKFSVKAPRLITHYKQFKESESLLADFYSTIRQGLKEKLGPVLFQLPAKIAFSKEFLQRILQSLDTSFNNVVEFRHESWWDNYVYEQLAQHHTSFCGISHPKLPDQIICNTNLVYYRFHGVPDLYYSQYPAKTIKKFSEDLKRNVIKEPPYIFFNNTATVAAINNATELKAFLTI